MSVGSKTVKYAAAAIVLAGVIIAASFLYIGSVSGSTNTSTSGVAGESVLAIQLTDPPQVPFGTSSLNLTYSGVNILVGEPASNGQVTTSTVSVNPSGGSATVNLFTLQNVSQTIASAKLPTGSTIYSVSFSVQKVSIDINGTVYPVTMATGTSTLGVTLAHPALLDSDSIALLELNPVVANTPTGYQLIPSVVGIMKPSSEFQKGDQDVGQREPLGQNDQQGLSRAVGKITARLVSMSVSGNTTTFIVQVNNTGSVPISLVAVGLHGNFTSASSCMGGDDSGYQNNNGYQNNQFKGYQGNHGMGNGHSRYMCGQHNEVVFSPVIPATASSTTSSVSSVTSTSAPAKCSAGQLTLVGGQGDEDYDGGSLTIAPGQCVNLTFTGIIAFGHSAPVVPSTEAGQVYTVHVIASNNAEVMMGCTLSTRAISCSAFTGNENTYWWPGP